MVTKMDVLLCFRADILLEIPRGDPGEYCTWDFVTLRLIRGCALGPLEASALW